MAYKNAMNKTGIYQDRENGMLKNHGMLKDLGMMQEEGMRGMRKMRGMNQTDEKKDKLKVEYSGKKQTPPGYTTEGLVAGGDPFVETSGQIVEKVVGGKKQRFRIKGDSVFKGGQYVGTKAEVMGE